MRGLNRVILSGVVSAPIRFGATTNGSPVCSFWLVTERLATGGPISVRIKVNAYSSDVVKECQGGLAENEYVIVEGELMAREERFRDLLEVRARLLIFSPAAKLRPLPCQEEGGAHG